MFSSDIYLNLPLGGTTLVVKGRVAYTPKGIELTVSDVSVEGTAPTQPVQQAPTSPRRQPRNARGRVIRSRVVPAVEEPVVEPFDEDDELYGVDESEIAGLARLVSFGPNNT